MFLPRYIPDQLLFIVFCYGDKLTSPVAGDGSSLYMLLKDTSNGLTAHPVSNGRAGVTKQAPNLVPFISKYR